MKGRWREKRQKADTYWVKVNKYSRHHFGGRKRVPHAEWTKYLCEAMVAPLKTSLNYSSLIKQILIEPISGPALPAYQRDAQIVYLDDK